MQAAGVFFETYSRDKALFKTGKQKLALGLFALALIAVPVVLGARSVAIGNIMLITGVVVLGLQLTTGFAGQINLGQSAFMGVGAYVGAIAATTWSLPFVLVIPLAGLAAAAFGSVFGLAAVRIKGFYLALTTLAAQFVFHFAILNLPAAWFGGSQGLRLSSPSLFGFGFGTDTRMYYLLLAVTAMMVAGAYGIVRSRHGRAFVAVRDDDVAAGLIGIDVVRTKAMAFFIGAFFAGVGGALWAYYIRFVQVDQFTLFFSVWYIGMIIVGGMGSIPGALLGVLVVRGAQEVLVNVAPTISSVIPALGGDVVFAGLNVLLGGIIILFLLFQPKGLMYRWNILKRAYRVWPFPY
ncbi:branched-chain amino acid ABC transporter permease [Nitriliruptoraceae bacterium ZYF776]|nr:branched-chain amino acid ABC transporter permease [Profundirhabdus halotolerans]